MSSGFILESDPVFSACSQSQALPGAVGHVVVTAPP